MLTDPARVYDQGMLALARFIHAKVLELPIELFMDEFCDCDTLAAEAMLTMERARTGLREAAVVI